MNPEHPQLDESELLDLIEGAALSPEQQSRANAALAADPALASRLVAMRADRAELIALGDVRAPSNLLSRVEAALEHDAIAGLAGAEHAAPVTIPTAPVMRDRSAVIAVLRHPWARGLAAAAVLSLVAGAILLSMRPAPPQSRPVDVATATTLKRETPIAKSPDPEVQKIVQEMLNDAETRRNLLREGADEAPIASAAAKESNSPDRERSAGQVNDLTAEPAPAPLAESARRAAKAPAISPETAAALAREDRLVIRIRALHPEATVARLDNLTQHADRAPRGSRLTRLEPADSARIAAAMQHDESTRLALNDQSSSPLPPPAPATGGRAGAPAAAASDQSGSAPATLAPISPAAPAPASPAFPVEVAVYRIDLVPQPAALEAALRALSQGEQSVEFIEASQPANLGLSLDPNAILWWGTPAASWTNKVGVPVVVELNLKLEK